MANGMRKGIRQVSLWDMLLPSLYRALFNAGEFRVDLTGTLDSHTTYQHAKSEIDDMRYWR